MTTVYETLCIPTQRLSVSWPAAGPEGEERRPAFLVGRLRGMFPGLGVEREAPDGRDLPPVRPPSRPGAGRALSGGGGGPGGPPGIRGAGGTDEAGRRPGAGPSVARGGGRPVRTAGAHVRLPHGQVQVLPLFLLFSCSTASRQRPAGQRASRPRSTAPLSTMSGACAAHSNKDGAVPVPRRWSGRSCTP